MTQQSTQAQNSKDGSPLFSRENVGKGEPERIQLSLSREQADYNLRQGLRMFAGNGFQWLPEYEEVADWLTDNNGKGLLMYGNCGRGKTLLGAYILPQIISWHLFNTTGEKKKVHICSYRDLNTDLYDLKKNYKMIYIDDLGQEQFEKVYGNRIYAFPDIVDEAEKRGTFLIISTNLSLDQLQEKYGDRVISRLRSLTKTVLFQGDDLRV